MTASVRSTPHGCPSFLLKERTTSREEGALGETTAKVYHLIIASKGTHSNLRQRYGVHNVSRTRVTGTNVFNSDEDIQQDTTLEEMGQAKADAVEDRNYFRSARQANLTNARFGLSEGSFQTWGEGKSMHFATVPLSSRNDYSHASISSHNKIWIVSAPLVFSCLRRFVRYDWRDLVLDLNRATSK